MDVSVVAAHFVCRKIFDKRITQYGFVHMSAIVTVWLAAARLSLSLGNAYGAWFSLVTFFGATVTAFGSVLQPVAPQLFCIDLPSPHELYKYLESFIFQPTSSFIVLSQILCLILVLEIESLATRQIGFIQNETAPMVITPKAYHEKLAQLKSFRARRVRNAL